MYGFGPRQCRLGLSSGPVERLLQLYNHCAYSSCCWIFITVMAKISGFLQNNIFSPYNSETVPIIMIMVATCSRTASLAIATGFAVAADASGLGQVAYAPMRWRS